MKEQELLHVQSVLNKSKAEGGQTESQESLRRQLRVTTDRNRQGEFESVEMQIITHDENNNMNVIKNRKCDHTQNL